MNEAPPTVLEPLVGFRKLIPARGGLVSPVARTLWREPTLKAECRLKPQFARTSEPHPEPHDAPHPQCGCGIYALHRRREMLATRYGTWAVVALWGRIEVHRLGMRAQFARVCALGVPERRDGANRTLAVARAMHIDAVPLDELDEQANHYGRPAEPWMLPPDPPPAEPAFRTVSDRGRPHFRFAIDDGRYSVIPFGWVTDGYPVVHPQAHDAAGDIFTHGDDRAVARFAHTSPGYRVEAEAALFRWACADMWSLHVPDGCAPLSRPPHEPDGQTLVCRWCRRMLGIGAAVRHLLATRGYFDTDCDACGGRMLGIRRKGSTR